MSASNRRVKYKGVVLLIVGLCSLAALVNYSPRFWPFLGGEEAVRDKRSSSLASEEEVMPMRASHVLTSAHEPQSSELQNQGQHRVEQRSPGASESIDGDEPNAGEMKQEVDAVPEKLSPSEVQKHFAPESGIDGLAWTSDTKISRYGRQSELMLEVQFRPEVVFETGIAGESKSLKHRDIGIVGDHRKVHGGVWKDWFSATKLTLEITTSDDGGEEYTLEENLWNPNRSGPGAALEIEEITEQGVLTIKLYGSYRNRELHALRTQRYDRTQPSIQKIELVMSFDANSSEQSSAKASFLHIPVSAGTSRTKWKKPSSAPTDQSVDENDGDEEWIEPASISLAALPKEGKPLFDFGTIRLNVSDPKHTNPRIAAQIGIRVPQTLPLGTRLSLGIFSLPKAILDEASAEPDRPLNLTKSWSEELERQIDKNALFWEVTIHSDYELRLSLLESALDSLSVGSGSLCVVPASILQWDRVARADITVLKRLADLRLGSIFEGVLNANSLLIVRVEPVAVGGVEIINSSLDSGSSNSPITLNKDWLQYEIFISESDTPQVKWQEYAFKSGGRQEIIPLTRTSRVLGVFFKPKAFWYAEIVVSSPLIQFRRPDSRGEMVYRELKNEVLTALPIEWPVIRQRADISLRWDAGMRTLYLRPQIGYTLVSTVPPVGQRSVEPKMRVHRTSADPLRLELAYYSTNRQPLTEPEDEPKEPRKLREKGESEGQFISVYGEEKAVEVGDGWIWLIPHIPDSEAKIFAWREARGKDKSLPFETSGWISLPADAKTFNLKLDQPSD